MNHRILLIMLLPLVGHAYPAVAAESNHHPPSRDSHTDTPPPVDDADYAAVLKNCVDDHGRVDYARLKSHRQPLDRFLEQLAEVRPERLARSEPAERIAFWINAYNALTLRSIIDHYPVASIRQIDGVWKKHRHRVAGRQLTLDQIEHQPDISHMASAQQRRRVFRRRF